MRNIRVESSKVSGKPYASTKHAKRTLLTATGVWQGIT